MYTIGIMKNFTAKLDVYFPGGKSQDFDCVGDYNANFKLQLSLQVQQIRLESVEKQKSDTRKRIQRIEGI